MPAVTLLEGAARLPSLPGVDAFELAIGARTLYGEARGETQFGQVACAWTMRNRVQDRRWPNDLASACLQWKQFSAWNPGDPNRALLIAVELGDPDYQACLAVMGLVVAGLVADPTRGCNHYLVTELHRRDPARWGTPLAPPLEIGHHTFLRL